MLRKIPAFWLFAVPYCLIWAVLCFLLQSNFREDILEQYFLGDQWVLACGKHPMLSAWYLNFIRFVTGNSEISPYLATESIKLVLLWGIWQLARDFLKDERLAFLTVLASANYYFLNIGQQVYNHDTFVTLCWGLSILFFYRALHKNRLADWVLTGFCLGLGFHAKYSIVLPIIAMLLFMAVNPHARRYWKTRGPYVTTGIAFLVFLPHLVWLIRNDFPTFHYAAETAGSRKVVPYASLICPPDFLLGVLMGWLPALATLIPLIGWPWQVRLRAKSTKSPSDRFHEAFLLVLIGVPIAIHLLVACMGRFQPARFGIPLGLYVPLLALLTLRLRTDAKALRRTLILGLLLVAAFMIAWSAKNVYAARYGSRPSANMFPGRVLAETVEHLWSDHYGDRPCPFVTDLTDKVGNRLAGVVNVYGNEHITVHDEWTTLESSNAEMNRRGGIVLWNLRTNKTLTFADVQQRYPRARRLPDLEISYPKPLSPKFPPETIGIAIIPPEGIGD